MAVDLIKRPPFPPIGQLMLPTSPVMLLLPEHAESLKKVNLTKKPAPPKKPKPITPEPKKFNGKIKLYWTELGDKDDIIVEVHDPQVYAILEVMHGTQELEMFARLNEDPRFDPFYQLVSDKVETYVNRVIRLRRLHTDKLSWDWA